MLVRKPVIKVWCLPIMTETNLKSLHRKIVAAVESVSVLGLKGEGSIVVLFPPDMMNYGLGSDIFIEITGLTIRPEWTQDVGRILAESVGRTIKGVIPRASVECVVSRSSSQDGFWSSEE